MSEALRNHWPEYLIEAAGLGTFMISACVFTVLVMYPASRQGKIIVANPDAVGQLIAYCGRSLDRTRPRYRVPPGFTKSEILFNMHRAAAGVDRSVVVVEGFFDCMKVYQAGIRSVVALMGSVLYEPQRHVLLERFSRVILLLDGDSAGRKASMVISQRLRPECDVDIISLPDGVQPDQLPAEDIGNTLPAHDY